MARYEIRDPLAVRLAGSALDSQILVYPDRISQTNGDSVAVGKHLFDVTLPLSFLVNLSPIPTFLHLYFYPIPLQSDFQLEPSC